MDRAFRSSTLPMPLLVTTAAFWSAPALGAQSADAQYRLAPKYHTGEGKPKDRHKAFDLFRKAAQQGHSVAQFYTALYYDLGCIFEKDRQQAATWYEKAADQGQKNAQYNLANPDHGLPLTREGPCGGGTRQDDRALPRCAAAGDDSSSALLDPRCS